MRTSTIPAALLLATVFGTGCSDQKAPTELSEGELGPQFNQAQVVFTESFSFRVFNPCTGRKHRNFVDITVREHVFDNDQNFHFKSHAQFDIVTSDGFSGSAIEHIVLNDEGTIAALANVNLSNDSGQRIKIHIQFHITVKNGRVRADVFKFSSTCVSNPDA